jgi:hypothetical protein
MRGRLGGAQIAAAAPNHVARADSLAPPPLNRPDTFSFAMSSPDACERGGAGMTHETSPPPPTTSLGSQCATAMPATAYDAGAWAARAASLWFLTYALPQVSAASPPPPPTTTTIARPRPPQWVLRPLWPWLLATLGVRGTLIWGQAAVHAAVYLASNGFFVALYCDAPLLRPLQVCRGGGGGGKEGG